MPLKSLTICIQDAACHVAEAALGSLWDALHTTAAARHAASAFGSCHSHGMQYAAACLHVQEDAIVSDVLLYLVLHRKGRARLCFRVELGLEVLVRVVFVRRHPRGEVPAQEVRYTCQITQ